MLLRASEALGVVEGRPPGNEAGRGGRAAVVVVDGFGGKSSGMR